MSMIVGLDVHSKHTVYTIQDETGRIIAQGSAETTVEGLTQMLVDHDVPGATRIGLESGAQSYWVSHVLSAAEMRPVVIDAHEVRAKARRIGQKGDRRDSFEVCDGLRRDIYTSIVWTPPAPVQRLREVLSQRRHYVRTATRETNSAKYLLRSRGLRLTAEGQRLALSSNRAWERLLERPEVEAIREYLALHFETWKTARAHVALLEKRLREALEPFRATIEILTSAPGVGIITAATYVAVIGAPERFASSSHVVSYIGLATSTYDTGDTERHGHITKRGSPDLRAALVEAAQHARDSRHPLNPYFMRVMVVSGYKRAVVAVAHRLARILYRMWRKKERFDLKYLNVERDPRTVSKTVYFRIRKQARQAA
jgi:transposase